MRDASNVLQQQAIGILGRQPHIRRILLKCKSRNHFWKALAQDVLFGGANRDRLRRSSRAGIFESWDRRALFSAVGTCGNSRRLYFFLLPPKGPPSVSPCRGPPTRKAVVLAPGYFGHHGCSSPRKFHGAAFWLRVFRELQKELGGKTNSVTAGFFFCPDSCSVSRPNEPAPEIPDLPFVASSMRFLAAGGARACFFFRKVELLPT